MKALRLNLCFQLPDDFKGNLNDALLEVINYRINNAVIGKERDVSEFNKDVKPLWGRFLENLEKGNKLTCDVALSELVNDKWEQLPNVYEVKKPLKNSINRNNIS